MKRTILIGATACALLGAVTGTAGAEGIPLTASEVDLSPGSAEQLGNAVGAGSVNAGSTAAALGSAFGGGYVGGALGEIISSISGGH